MVKQKSKSLLCTDLIRIAVFNKDFYNMKCMLGFQVVGKFSNSNFFFGSLITEQMFCILYSIGQHVTFYLTTLLYDALYVMVEVGHVNVPMSLEQVPAFLASLDTHASHHI
jgi:hypothetical protein